MQLRKWQKYTLEILLVIAVVVGIQQYQKRNLVSGEIPPFSATWLDGRPFDSAEMQGKTYLLHFWASWCRICRLEQSAIESISQDHPVITVAMQSGNADDVQAYMQEHALTFPVLLDEYGELARHFGVRGVPTSMVIDEQGRIRFSEVGFTTQWGLRLRMLLSS